MKKRIYFVTALLGLLVSCNLTDASKVALERISFSENVLEMQENEKKFMEISYLPSDCEDVEIIYEVIPKDVVKLSDESSAGLIIEALKSGSCVVTAKSGNIIDYLQINVSDSEFTLYPYIALPFATLEMDKGSRKTVIANLYGVESPQTADYTWTSSNEGVISIDTASNVCVLKANKYGTSVITVTSSKAEYSASMAVYVSRDNDNIFYLTTEKNLLSMTTGNVETFNVECVGGLDSELSLIRCSVVDGEEVVSVTCNNGQVSVHALKSGRCILRFTHPKSSVELDVTCIVNDKVDNIYINTDGDFILIDDGSMRVINCSLVGARKKGVYSISIEDESIIDVVAENNRIFVTPKKNGSSKIEITNTECKTAKTLLVVVEKTVVYNSIYSISTSQNVIKAEVGDELIPLYINLNGGNPSDSSGFTWNVSDSSVLQVTTSDGVVNYARSAGSSDLNRNVYKGCAYLNPVGSGICEIEVMHAKTDLKQKVTVYVYPKGTYKNRKVYIRGENFVTVKIGEKKNYDYALLQGNFSGEEKWHKESGDSIAYEWKNNALVLEGVKSGLTVLKLKDGNMGCEYEVSVFCGTEQEIENVSFINTSNNIVEVIKGNTCFIGYKIAGSLDYNNVEVLNTDDDVCSAVKSYDSIMIQGKKKGECDVILSCEGSMNSVRIHVVVVDGQDSVLYPYSLSGKSFFGVVLGKSDRYKVGFDGPDIEKSYIDWNYDGECFRVDGNGDTALISALNNGTQEMVITHPKSSNEKKVILYSCESESELQTKTVLYAHKTNYIMKKGEKIFVEVDVNKDEYVPQIRWQADNIENIKIEGEGKGVVVSALKEGNSCITVNCADSLPLNIYVSVVEHEIVNESYYLKAPSIIEMVQGDNYILTTESKGIPSNLISYSCSDDGLGIKGNGNICYIQALRSGCYDLTVSVEGYPELKRNIEIIVYENERQSGYVMSLSKVFYRMDKGDELTVKIESGKKIFDDVVKSSIKWSLGCEGVVEVYPNGNTALFKAVGEGVCTVRVSSEKIINDVEFEICVSNETVEVNEVVFNVDRIIGIKTGDTRNISYTMTKDGNDFADYSNVTVEKTGNVFDCIVSDGILRISGIKEGTGFITLHYKNSGSAKLMVCVNETGIVSSFMWFIDRDNIVLDRGKTAEFNIYCSDDSGLDGLSYEVVEGNGNVEVTGNGSCFKVKGLNEGSSKIVLRFKGQEMYVNVYVTSSENVECDIRTESIVCVKKGETKTTCIYCEKTVSFVCKDSEIAAVSASGNNCSIEGKNTGITELVVSESGGNSRTVLVCVYEDESVLNQLFNIDARNYKVGKGYVLNLSPYFYSVNFDRYSLRVSEISGNGCLDCSYDNGVIRIEACNEGYGTVRVENGVYRFDLNVVVVPGFSDGGNYVMNTDSYMYSDVTDLNLEDIGDTYTLTATVKSLSDGSIKNDEFKWNCSDFSVLEITPAGNSCIIRGLKEGRCVVSVSNIGCSNVLNFTVTVGNVKNVDLTTQSYVKLSKSFVSINYVDGYAYVDYEICNVANPDPSKVTFNAGGNGVVSCENVYTSKKGMLKINVLKTGNERIEVRSSQCSIVSVLDVLVVNDVQASIPYLTTKNNYSTVKPGSMCDVEVRLVNYDEYDSGNFKWDVIEGKSYVTLIGSGSSVRVYGNSEGFVKLRCTHVPTSSFIDMYVIVSYSITTSSYITTANNVIETYISKNMDSFEVSVVGLSEGSYSLRYSVKDPDILSVTGSGNTCYYRGLKAGVTQITVTDVNNSVYELNVTVVVMSKGSTDSYLSCDQSSVYMKPGETSSSVNVTFNNVANADESKLEWYIYSSVASGSQKDVVSIVSSGKRCVIKGLNEGYAKIRCFYPINNLFCNIGVYVSKTGTVDFVDEHVTVCENDSIFANIVIPSYVDDVQSLIVYSSDNPDVCTVFGTGRACCIVGKQKGSAVVTASNLLDGTSSQIGVSVVKEDDMMFGINLHKNAFILNPRSGKQNMRASVFGDGIRDIDQDNLEWEIESDTSGCMSIYPSKGHEVNLNLNFCDVLGDEDYGKVKCGEAIISVKHPKCNNGYKKTIYVSIREKDGYFTLDKYSMNIAVSESMEVRCILDGAKPSDYENVSWSLSCTETDSYGNKVEVARCMNMTGERCTVYGLNDGTAVLNCFYGGDLIQCEVNVQASRVFRLSGGNSYSMFPDVDAENYLEIGYVLRPSTFTPTWNIRNSDGSEVSVIDLVDVSTDTDQKIRISPKGVEGKVTVTGFVAGVGSVSFTVNLEFSPVLTLDSFETEYNITMYDEGTSGYEQTHNSISFGYSSYPSMYYIGVSCEDKYSDPGIYYAVDNNLVKGETIYDFAQGTVTVSALREMKGTHDSPCIKLTITQYRDAALKNAVKSTVVHVNINYAKYEDNSDFPAYLSFMRGIGGYSMMNDSPYDFKVNDMLPPKFVNDDSGNMRCIYNPKGNGLRLVNGKMDLGDGESHYVVLSPLHKGQYMENITFSLENIDDIDVNFKPSLKQTDNIVTVSTGKDMGVDIGTDLKVYNDATGKYSNNVVMRPITVGGWNIRSLFPKDGKYLVAGDKINNYAYGLLAQLDTTNLLGLDSVDYHGWPWFPSSTGQWESGNLYNYLLNNGNFSYTYERHMPDIVDYGGKVETRSYTGSVYIAVKRKERVFIYGENQWGATTDSGESVSGSSSFSHKYTNSEYGQLFKCEYTVKINYYFTQNNGVFIESEFDINIPAGMISKVTDVSSWPVGYNGQPIGYYQNNHILPSEVLELAKKNGPQVTVRYNTAFTKKFYGYIHIAKGNEGLLSDISSRNFNSANLSADNIYSSPYLNHLVVFERDDESISDTMNSMFGVNNSGIEYFESAYLSNLLYWYLSGFSGSCSKITQEIGGANSSNAGTKFHFDATYETTISNVFIDSPVSFSDYGNYIPTNPMPRNYWPGFYECLRNLDAAHPVQTFTYGYVNHSNLYGYYISDDPTYTTVNEHLKLINYNEYNMEVRANMNNWEDNANVNSLFRQSLFDMDGYSLVRDLSDNYWEENIVDKGLGYFRYDTTKESVYKTYGNNCNLVVSYQGVDRKYTVRIPFVIKAYDSPIFFRRHDVNDNCKDSIHFTDPLLNATSNKQIESYR